MNTEVRKATKGWREYLGLPVVEQSLEIERLRPGLRVRFSHPKAGYTVHQDIAKQYLNLNKVYTVKSFRIDTFHTDVWLEGFDVPFNSVMFDEALYDNE